MWGGMPGTEKEFLYYQPESQLPKIHFNSWDLSTSFLSFLLELKDYFKLFLGIEKRLLKFLLI